MVEEERPSVIKGRMLPVHLETISVVQTKAQQASCSQNRKRGASRITKTNEKEKNKAEIYLNLKSSVIKAGGARAIGPHGVRGQKGASTCLESLQSGGRSTRTQVSFRPAWATE